MLPTIQSRFLAAVRLKPSVIKTLIDFYYPKRLEENGLSVSYFTLIHKTHQGDQTHQGHKTKLIILKPFSDIICTIQSFLPVFLSFSPYKMSQSLKWVAIAYILVYNENKICGLLIPIGMPCSRRGKIRENFFGPDYYLILPPSNWVSGLNIRPLLVKGGLKKQISRSCCKISR